MDIKIRTEKTYCIEVTESQARDLLEVACEWTRLTDKSKRLVETLRTLRELLLNSGLKKDPD